MNTYPILAIFAPMLLRLRQFLNRPLAEDFSFFNQFRMSLQGGLYVCVFIYLFGGIGDNGAYPRLVLLLFFGLAVVLSTLIANYVIPSLLPALYDEDHWTVSKHALHVLLVLFCVSVGNQAVLMLTQNERPSFGHMYLMVTAIGFFPITVGVFVAEQRRLKHNLAHARTLNEQLDKLHQTSPVATMPELPEGITLTSETGKDQLSLLPNQLIYIESTGNYVEVHWLNMMFPQKTVLRGTLREMETALQDHPQFFRCHRAFIVNLKAIHETEGNARGYQLTISGSGKAIPVSRGYVSAFDARMQTLV